MPLHTSNNEPHQLVLPFENAFSKEEWDSALPKTGTGKFKTTTMPTGLQLAAIIVVRPQLFLTS